MCSFCVQTLITHITLHCTSFSFWVVSNFLQTFSSYFAFLFVLVSDFCSVSSEQYLRMVRVLHACNNIMNVDHEMFRKCHGNFKFKSVQERFLIGQVSGNQENIFYSFP